LSALRDAPPRGLLAFESFVKSDIDHQVPDPHAQSIRDDLHCPEGDALLSVFQPIKMSSVKSSKFRQLVLSQAVLRPKSFNPQANLRYPVPEALGLLNQHFTVVPIPVIRMQTDL